MGYFDGAGTPTDQNAAQKVRRLTRKVTGDCRVELDTNRYSIPFQLVGQTVDLKVVAGEMTINWRGKPVPETHGFLRHDLTP